METALVERTNFPSFMAVAQSQQAPPPVSSEHEPSYRGCERKCGRCDPTAWTVGHSNHRFAERRHRCEGDGDGP